MQHGLLNLRFGLSYMEFVLWNILYPEVLKENLFQVEKKNVIPLASFIAIIPRNYMGNSFIHSTITVIDITL
jgi:hypothetical protein